MSETQCQRLDVRVGFTNLVTRLCYTSHLGVQSDIGIRRDSRFVIFSFPFLDCCKAFSGCRLATHSIYVLGRFLPHRGTDFFGPVRNASRLSLWETSWCHNVGCSVDMRVAEWIWWSLSEYDSCQVNVDWSEWIGEDCMCYNPTSTTRCAQTHAPRDDHSNTDCHGDANMQVDPVEKVQQIEVRRVWRSKMVVSWDK